MKQRTFNLLFFGLALCSGVGMFLLKYYVLEQEKTLRQNYQQIRKMEHELHLLNADWAMLTTPADLRRRAQKLSVKPLQAKQIIQSDIVPARPAPVPMTKPKTWEDADVL